MTKTIAWKKGNINNNITSVLRIIPIAYRFKYEQLEVYKKGEWTKVIITNDKDSITFTF